MLFDAINPTILSAFIPTFFLVSVTPGLCMTLAMTLGMSIGFRQALWMMSGELVGVGLIAITAVVGAAAVMLKYPQFFSLLKYGGGCYLAYVGINMWLSKGKMALSLEEPTKSQRANRLGLASLGFFTAIGNPKGWAFFIALLPPFIDVNRPLAGQLGLLVAIILLLEFLCLCLYSLGGGVMRRFLQHSQNVRMLNRVAATMMFGVTIWLVLD